MKDNCIFGANPHHAIKRHLAAIDAIEHGQRNPGLADALLGQEAIAIPGYCPAFFDIADGNADLAVKILTQGANGIGQLTRRAIRRFNAFFGRRCLGLSRWRRNIGRAGRCALSRCLRDEAGAAGERHSHQGRNQGASHERQISDPKIQTHGEHSSQIFGKPPLTVQGMSIGRATLRANERCAIRQQRAARLSRFVEIRVP